MKLRWCVPLCWLAVACGDSSSGDDVTADAGDRRSRAGGPTASRCVTRRCGRRGSRDARLLGPRSAPAIAAPADAAIAALDAAAHARRLARRNSTCLLGLAHLWRLAEPLPDETMAPAVQLTSANAARDHLRQAYALCPTDHRIPAWLGPILVRFGRTLGDQAQIDEGLAILEAGVAAYPSFVLFSKLLVFADYPRDAPEFQQALDAVVANADACAAAPADPACLDHPRAAHNREGGVVFFGDALAKAGRRAEAEAIYRAALAEPGYGTWDHQGVLADRLATLDARIAAYATPDPSDDPVAAWAAPNQCALCHTD
jgi:hypothetical protein